MHGRREPYTDIGIKRLPCCRCGQKARYQWSICSDDNLWRPLCIECDIAMNKMVLEFIGFNDSKDKIKQYIELLNDIA